MPRQKITPDQVHFGKTNWGLSFKNCGSLPQELVKIFSGWNTSKSRSIRSVRAEIAYEGNNWTWKPKGHPPATIPRLWLKSPPKTPMRVICDIHDVSIYWYLEKNPELLCLHAAAVKIGDGVICFPSTHKAGKSTLIAALAHQGHQIFADDVLLVKRGSAMAFGFAPRLRVPIPSKLSQSLQSFIAQHTAIADSRLIYFNPERNLAPLGTTEKFKAFVLLERVENSPTRMEPARQVDVLKALVAQNIITTLPLTNIFDRMLRLCKKFNAYKLTYSDTEEAADFLNKFFGVS